MAAPIDMSETTHAGKPHPAGDVTWSRFRYPGSVIRGGLWLGTLVFLAYSMVYLNIDLKRILGLIGFRTGA